MSLVSFGRFGRAHGVRGELRFWPHNPQSPLLKAGRAVRIGREAGQTEVRRVERLRFDAKGPLLTIEGVDSREAAEALTGAEWFEDRAAFAPIEDPDEIYCVDLIGLEARTVDGAPLGRVVDVMTDTATAVLVIRGARGQHLVPFVEAFVPRVDLAAGEVQVSPIEGLLDG